MTTKRRVTGLTDNEIAEFVSKWFSAVESVEVTRRNVNAGYVECIIVTDWVDTPGALIRRGKKIRLYEDGDIITENSWLEDWYDMDAQKSFMGAHNIGKLPLVINLYGAPGSGKSTGAAYIFSQLKLRNINCELITEYAKEKVWEGAEAVLQHQLYVFAKQQFRMARCKDKVDALVTDSPLLLSAYYNMRNNEQVVGNFHNLVFDIYNTYNNLDCFIYRQKPYNPTGRLQTKEEALNMERDLQNFLGNRGVGYTVLPGTQAGYDRIVDEALKILSQKEGKC